MSLARSINRPSQTYPYLPAIGVNSGTIGDSSEKGLGTAIKSRIMIKLSRVKIATNLITYAHKTDMRVVTTSDERFCQLVVNVVIRLSCSAHPSQEHPSS